MSILKVLVAYDANKRTFCKFHYNLSTIDSQGGDRKMEEDGKIEGDRKIGR